MNREATTTNASFIDVNDCLLDNTSDGAEDPLDVSTEPLCLGECSYTYLPKADHREIVLEDDLDNIASNEHTEQLYLSGHMDGMSDSEENDKEMELSIER